MTSKQNTAAKTEKVEAPVEQPKSMTIKEAAVFLNTKEQYVRSLIRSGKLSSTEEQIGTNLWRHRIPFEELVARKNGGRKTGRADGRNKFILYATPTEKAALEELAQQNGLSIKLEPAYDPIKGKLNYAKQKARKAAKKAATTK